VKISKIFLLFITSLISFNAIAQNENLPVKTEAPYFKSPNSDKGLDDLPLKSTKTSVIISVIIADVTLTQSYANYARKPLEAVYVFPMSDKAAVYSLEMHIGTRVIKAAIKERNEASTEY